MLQKISKLFRRKHKNSYTNTDLLKPVKKYSFVFVCQKGQIEIESLFLAASLKHFLKCDYELIAMVPGPESYFGKPSAITLNLLKKMGVRVEFMNNDVISKTLAKNPDTDFSIRENKLLFMSNKIYCLKIPMTGDKTIFLDSDIFFTKAFYGDICFSIPYNALRYIGIGGYTKMDGEWDKLFKFAKVKMPNLRVKINKKKEGQPDCLLTPPLFMAGVFGINTELLPEFSETWLELFNRFYAARPVGDIFFVEEYTLILTAHKLELPYNVLARDWDNFAIFHYHNMDKMKSNREVVDLAKLFIEKYPEIKDMIRDNENWNFLLSE